jgi:galactokinase
LPELFVPGRLCLFGEHSDWAAGYRPYNPEIPRGHCIAAGTDQGLRARAERLPGRLEISTALPSGERRGPGSFALEARTLESAARREGFFRYAAGVTAELCTRHDVDGARIEITRADLPIGKGLSSSAAVCVLVARAFSELYGLGLDARDEMELAYAGERRAGSECGRLDQICALGQRSVFLTFDGEDVAVELLEPGDVFWILIVDLARGKDTRRILADLNRCFPDTPGPLAERVREALGRGNAALLGRARDRLEQGDAPGLGALMSEAQELFDSSVAPASPELRAPRLHEVLDHAAVRELAWGGKGVGSGGDGCAQLVARGAEERNALARRLERELGVTCLPLTLRSRAPAAP